MAQMTKTGNENTLVQTALGLSLKSNTRGVRQFSSSELGMMA
jgi:hypothetical protein